jgi:hypothetical protein
LSGRLTDLANFGDRIASQLVDGTWAQAWDDCAYNLGVFNSDTAVKDVGRNIIDMVGLADQVQRGAYPTDAHSDQPLHLVQRGIDLASRMASGHFRNAFARLSTAGDRLVNSPTWTNAVNMSDNVSSLLQALASHDMIGALSNADSVTPAVSAAQDVARLAKSFVDINPVLSSLSRESGAPPVVDGVIFLASVSRGEVTAAFADYNRELASLKDVLSNRSPISEFEWKAEQLLSRADPQNTLASAFSKVRAHRHKSAQQLVMRRISHQIS